MLTLAATTLAVCLPCASPAQSRPSQSGDSVLERRYKAAQDFQAVHDLDKAAAQYRIFIADALGELALGHAKAASYDKASDEFDEALNLVPVFPALQLEYARVALESGQLERARKLAAGVVNAQVSDPKFPAKAHALLGRVLLAMGRNTEARQEMEQAVRLDPTFENGYTLAVIELNLGDGDAARKLFAEMQSSFGDTAAIHMLFGQAYGGSDLQADAVREFQRAISMDDKLPGAHYALASAYLATSGTAKLADVKAELRKEIAISPNAAAPYAALGHLLAGEGESDADKAEGLRDLKHATELDPRSPDPFLYLGQFYVDAKKVPEAEAALRQSIALTRDVSRNGYQVQKAHYLLGRLLIQEGHADEGRKEIADSQALRDKNLKRDQDRLADYMQENAASTLRGDTTVSAPLSHAEDAQELSRTDAFARQFGPAIADSYNNLGAIAGSHQNYRLAVRYFERAAEWSPSLPGLDYNWGRAAFAAGDTAEAVGPLSRYVQAHPEDEGARTVLGLSQFLSKDYAGARKTLQTVVDKPQQSSQVQYAYADSLVETSQTAEGINRLQALEKATPDVADVHRALGRAYALQKDPAAVAELEAALRLNPHDDESRRMLATLKADHP